MNAKDAIKSALTSTHHILKWYLSDLSDADLLVRPVPGANHVAWQVGHLIHSERNMLAKYIPGGSPPELPAGWGEQHSNKEGAAKQAPDGFRTKAEYLALFNQVREATLAALAKLPDTDLDKPVPWKFAPTVGAVFLLQANHTMMHAGQFSVVRRKLGKPVLF
jgi:DinB family protein